MSPFRLFTFLLALFGLQPLAAEYLLYDNIYNPKTGTRLTLSAMSDALPSSGYFAVRVNAKNGEKIPTSWTFNFTSKDHSWGDSNNLTSTFSLSCAPGRQKNVEFLVPVVTAIHSESPLELRLDISARPPLRSAAEEMSSEQTHQWPRILMSQDLDTRNSGPLDAAVSSGRSGSGSDFAGAFSPQSLTQDWRGYQGYDVLMLTSQDWKNIPPGAKDAIKKWNRLGGRIIIYQSAPSVTFSSLGIEGEQIDEQTLQRTWGEIKLLKLPSSSLLNAPNTVKLIKSGELNPRAVVIGEELTSNWPLQLAFGQRSFNPVFFILILIAFGIIVGPINLFVFAKANQRHRLFITTPIISLSASALLLVIIIFQDGFGGKGFRHCLIEIRPEENTAYIEQQQIARTGVLFKTSFEAKTNAIISPVVLDESRWTRITPYNNGGESRYRITEREQNKHKLSGDWFKSRSEYGHFATSVQATRGRLELASPNGPPILSSTFDFPLAKIYYIDKSGGIWQSDKELKRGKKIQLSPCPRTDFNKWLTSQEADLNANSQTRLKLIVDRQNHFIALSEEGPFIDTLSSLSWKQSTALLTGPVVSK